jgi:hypothetical protein
MQRRGAQAPPRNVPERRTSHQALPDWAVTQPLIKFLSSNATYRVEKMEI